MQFLAVIWDFFDVLHDFWSFELRQKTGYYGLHTFFEVSGRYLGVNLVFGLHHWSKKKDPKYALMCNFRIETTLTPPKIDVKLPMRAPWNRLITLITMVWLVFDFPGFFEQKICSQKILKFPDDSGAENQKSEFFMKKSAKITFLLQFRIKLLTTNSGSLHWPS